MRRDEAEAICERLNREHPERGSHRWFPREASPGSWGVARVAVGGLGVATGTAQPGKPTTPTPGNPGELPGGVSPWVGPG